MPSDEFLARFDRCRRECGADDPLACLQDHEVITQFGKVEPGLETFRVQLRTGETDMSVLRGALTAEDAALQVYGRSRLSELDVAASRVRHTVASALRTEGFIVGHTPGKVKPLHVSVFWPGTDLGNYVAPWPIKVTEMFEACFNPDEGDEG